MKVEFHESERYQTWAEPVDPYSTTCWLVSVTKNIWGRTCFMKINRYIMEENANCRVLK